MQRLAAEVVASDHSDPSSDGVVGEPDALGQVVLEHEAERAALPELIDA